MSFFYTENCALTLAQQCDKYETPLRIIYTLPEDSELYSKHFLYHDYTQIGTDNEYGTLGKLRKIVYLKNEEKYVLTFDFSDIEPVDPRELLFMYENVKR